MKLQSRVVDDSDEKHPSQGSQICSFAGFRGREATHQHSPATPAVDNTTKKA